MAAIRFVRTLVIEEHSLTFDREDLPEILRPLLDGPSLTVSDLTIEQNDAIDELLAAHELTLGDTLDSTPFTIERFD